MENLFFRNIYRNVKPTIPANDDGVKSVQFILDNFKKVLVANDDTPSDESSKKWVVWN